MLDIPISLTQFSLRENQQFPLRKDNKLYELTDLRGIVSTTSLDNCGEISIIGPNFR